MKKITFYYFLIFTFIFAFQSCSSDSDNIVLDVNHTELSFTDISTKSVTISTTDNWTAEAIFPAGVTPWFEISPTSGSGGSHYISVKTLDLNYGKEARTGTILIRSNNITQSVEIKQTPYPQIELSALTSNVPADGGSSEPITLDVNTDWTVDLKKDSSFPLNFNFSPTNYGTAGTYTLTFTATEANLTDANKTAALYITSGKETKIINITQKRVTSNIFYEDKDVVTLQQSTKGAGVNLLFMGDGFTEESMDKGTGAYEKAMKQAMENFFSIEPYKSYRSYFNVYMIAAISETSTFGSSPGNTKFKCYFGNGTLIGYNSDTSMVYINRVFKDTNVQQGDITVGLILNSTRYAGTCDMWSHGLSISRCPMSTSPAPNNFKGLVQHEMGGHGFARVADEYIYNATEQIPQSEINLRRTWQGYGAYQNVDFTSNLSNILWKDFIGRSGYEQVGAYEGALTYGMGVWRPESNSCMNNNVPYYNAQTRWLAVKRIMSIAKVPFSFEQFLQADVIDQSAQSYARAKAADRAMPPLHPPIMID